MENGLSLNMRQKQEEVERQGVQRRGDKRGAEGRKMSCRALERSKVRSREE